jgi:hypothetical protein
MHGGLQSSARPQMGCAPVATTHGGTGHPVGEQAAAVMCQHGREEFRLEPRGQACHALDIARRPKTPRLQHAAVGERQSKRAALTVVPTDRRDLSDLDDRNADCLDQRGQIRAEAGVERLRRLRSRLHVATRNSA